MFSQLISSLNKALNELTLTPTGKSYSSQVEEAQRMSSWISNRKMVVVHNMLADQGIKSYRLGMTYFADMVRPRNMLL